MNATCNEVLQLAREMMDQHGLQSWRVGFTDAKRLHGQCRTNEKLILLRRADVFRMPAKFVKDTILHEIAHALCPHAGHGKAWRDCAYRIGVRDPGYGRYNLNAEVRKGPKPIDYTKKWEQAEEHVAKLNTRIKRLQTAVKKWERRERLYRTKATQQRTAMASMAVQGAPSTCP